MMLEGKPRLLLEVFGACDDVRIVEERRAWSASDGVGSLLTHQEGVARYSGILGGGGAVAGVSRTKRVCDVGGAKE